MEMSVTETDVRSSRTNDVPRTRAWFAFELYVGPGVDEGDFEEMNGKFVDRLLRGELDDLFGSFTT